MPLVLLFRVHRLRTYMAQLSHISTIFSCTIRHICNMTPFLCATLYITLGMYALIYLHDVCTYAHALAALVAHTPHTLQFSGSVVHLDRFCWGHATGLHTLSPDPSSILQDTRSDLIRLIYSLDRRHQHWRIAVALHRAVGGCWSRP